MAEPRPLRADAERNRRRILDAARTVFAARGLDAGVDDVARAAGVGVGTVYRRFPTKEALVTAALQDRAVELLRGLDDAAADPDPGAALERAAHTLVGWIVADHAFYEGVHECYPQSAWATEPRKRIIELLRDVAARAHAAGVLRRDVTADDLMPLLATLARLPAWRLEEQPRLWERYLAVTLDGLRAEAARGVLPGEPPTSTVPRARRRAG
jgi:AcrR family transcriptional regulator